MATACPDDDLQVIIRYKSLWKQIQDVLRPSELEIVQRVIGSDLIDDNECLLNELDNLVSILRDCQKATKAEPSRGPTWSLLPHLPAHELQSKLMCLLQRVSVQPSTPREKQIIDFVVHNQSFQLDSSLSSNSPSTSQSSSSTSPAPTSLQTTVHRPVSAPTVGKRLMSSCSAKLNVFDIDSVRDDLVEAFHEEHRCLLKNVEIVRDRLEQSVNDNRQPAPTLQELSTLHHRLEEEDAKQAHQQRITNLPDPRTRPISEPVSAPPSLRSNLSSRSSMSSSHSSRSLRNGASGTPPGTLHLHPITLQLNTSIAKAAAPAAIIAANTGAARQGVVAKPRSKAAGERIPACMNGTPAGS